jgi:type I pantothenate kinase
LKLRHTAFADPNSYFHRYASLTDAEAVDQATEIWTEINEPNLVHNILPTRARAGLVLQKSPDHSIDRVRLRKL